MMTRARLDGLQMLIVGSIFFVAIGALMEHFNPLRMTDFLQIYASARCVAHHHDPYKADELLAFYQSDSGGIPTDSGVVSRTYRKIVFIAPNLPTTLFLIAPISALPWKWAVVVWMALIAACFIVACYFVWRVGADSAPRLCGGLILFILINSGLLLETGNTAGLAVSLSVIAACCFLEDRFVPAGVVCLAVALIMKPHDAGPVWLYFLLAGSSQRKRALQAAGLTAVLIIPAVMWVAHSAPHWSAELQANLAGGLGSGGLNNPGPTTQGGRGIGQIISLQAVLSLIRDDARFYNPVAYILCGALLLLWCVRTLRVGFSRRAAWLALAAIAALTMLPFYHRTYDARLLLLAVPACAGLWIQGRAAGRVALLLTLAAIILTGDIFWVVLFQITHYSGPSVFYGMIPAPLMLLALGVFYLCVYLREAPAAPAAVDSSGTDR
jgi:Glycosyltransferase family 87